MCILSAELLQSLLDVITSLPENIKKEEVVQAIKVVGNQHGLKMPAIMKFIRIAVFGIQVSPQRVTL